MGNFFERSGGLLDFIYELGKKKLKKTLRRKKGKKKKLFFSLSQFSLKKAFQRGNWVGKFQARGFIGGRQIGGGGKKGGRKKFFIKKFGFFFNFYNFSEFFLFL